MFAGFEEIDTLPILIGIINPLEKEAPAIESIHKSHSIRGGTLLNLREGVLTRGLSVRLDIRGLLEAVLC